MDLKHFIVILLTNLLFVARGEIDFGSGFKLLYPCKGNRDIYYKYSNGQPIDKEILFFVHIDEDFPAKSIVNITIILPSESNLGDAGADLSIVREEVVDIVLFENQKNLNFSLNTIDRKTPYITSVLVNKVERCINPLRERDESGPGTGSKSPTKPTGKVLDCGRRKVVGTELLVGGQSTKPGYWPWHVALTKSTGNADPTYICGGSLISASMVLTAAHCVTESGAALVPSRLRVKLGKYHLYNSESTVVEKGVFRNIPHPDYKHKTLENDIALLELETEIGFTDYIRPACLWHADDYLSLPSPEIHGTVVGWGLSKSGHLSQQLEQLRMPKIDNLECIHSNPIFFENALNGKNFCAGYHNETHPQSACNGDSGGGFAVFVPDIIGDSSKAATGTWHIRGITSRAVAGPQETTCDPTQYAVFTDVSHYINWIEDKII